MRYLAIDLGDKRTGLAVGDIITRRALPVKVVEVPITEHAGESLLAALAKEIDALIDPREACTLVVGLPLNMDGTEGPRAKGVRDFAQRIQSRCKRDLAFQDERLTSVQADWDMARSGLTHAQKKARRDALAAATLLQDYLDNLKPDGGSGGVGGLGGPAEAPREPGD